MPRRLNYTRRERVLHEHVNVQLHRGQGGELSFDAQLALADYRFSKGKNEESPKVYLEAYRGATASWKRFDFGTVGKTSMPADRSLREFRVPEGILFRLRVTSRAMGQAGRLLGEADGVRPKGPTESEGFVQPLIQHMPADDIGDELWRIHFPEGDMPILKINDRIAIGVEQFLLNPAIRAIYAPMVMRQILQRVLIIEDDIGDEDDEDDWRQRWIRFGTRFANRAPDRVTEVDREAVEQWIDEAVEAFAKASQFLTSFNAEESV